MLPRTFLTQLIPARIAEATRRLHAQIWQPLPDEAAGIKVAHTPVYREFRDAPGLKPSDFTPVPEGASNWGPKYAQRWYKVSLPASIPPPPRCFRQGQRQKRRQQHRQTHPLPRLERSGRRHHLHRRRSLLRPRYCAPLHSHSRRHARTPC
ncbi:hypothetical protein [Geminisphaera colitermitum]|uniref:hypothetical protein n=1 Tax=Geminisphaera colitermitum TaxID=1148786 RepID=UPI001E65A8F2|nr:hypothetical protein [Geminisphaera colitermitum]